MVNSFKKKHLNPAFKTGLFFILVLITGQVSAKKFPGDSPNSNTYTSNNLNYSRTSAKLPANIWVDSLAVHKAAHEMLVFNNGKLITRYTICLGKNPVGAKHYEGDFKTPEGLYSINVKYETCHFHKGLQISYPSKSDVARAKKANKSPGGGVLIHGLPNGAENLGPNRYRNDWTWGCIGLRNNEIDDLFAHVQKGVPIFITP